MAFFFFSFYLFLFSFAIIRFRFFAQSGVPSKGLLGYFWLKTAAAIGYGYYHAITRQGGDTWTYHRYGLEETTLLRTHSVQFFTSVFHSGYNNYAGFWSTNDSFWNDLDANTIPKLLAFCNLLSGGNYYVNTIFFNFLFFSGTVLLFKAWKKAAPGIHGLWQYLPFLIPSFLFWTSGIHKEGFLVLAIAMIAHALFAHPGNGGKKARRLLQVALGLGILLALRNFLLLPAGLAILSWVCTTKMRLSASATLCAGILLGCLLFFGSRRLFPQLDVSGILQERSAAFLQKRGNSKVAAVKLEPGAVSLIQNGPAAFAIGAFRPLPGDVHHAASGMAAAESVALLLLLVFSLYRLRHFCWKVPFLFFCLCFTIPLFLIIGYTVPFLGAVVRYRSVTLPLWTMALLLIAVSKPPGNTPQKA